MIKEGLGHVRKNYDALARPRDLTERVCLRQEDDHDTIATQVLFFTDGIDEGLS